MPRGAGMSVGAKLQQVCSVMAILLGLTRPGTGVQIQSIASSVTATCQSPDCKGIQTWTNHSSCLSQVLEVQWLTLPQSLVLVLLSVPMQRRTGPGWSPRLPSKGQDQLLPKTASRHCRADAPSVWADSYRLAQQGLLSVQISAI